MKFGADVNHEEASIAQVGTLTSVRTGSSRNRGSTTCRASLHLADPLYGLSGLLFRGYQCSSPDRKIVAG